MITIIKILHCGFFDKGFYKKFSGIFLIVYTFSLLLNTVVLELIIEQALKNVAHFAVFYWKLFGNFSFRIILLFSSIIFN
jgi:hypothetical protein